MASQWADVPNDLLSTTRFSQDLGVALISCVEDFEFTEFSSQSSYATNYVAAQMALGILRGLSSIYAKPAKRRHEDKARFLDLLPMLV